jgi:hypothetical protein
MGGYIDNPELWRLRAEEIRTVAETMNGLNARAAKLSIAESYERIAADAERRLAAKLLRVPT